MLQLFDALGPSVESYFYHFMLNIGACRVLLRRLPFFCAEHLFLDLSVYYISFCLLVFILVVSFEL